MSYVDPNAPRLSDFLMERRITWQDDRWPFGSAGPIVMKVGGPFNQSLNWWTSPIADPEFEAPWKIVILGGTGASNWYMSGQLSRSFADWTGDEEDRAYALEQQFKTMCDRLGLDKNLAQFPGYVDGEQPVTGFAGRLAYVDPNTDEAGDLLDEYRLMVNDTDLFAKAGWREAVAAWFDEKIENDGWRFLKPWASIPQVRPLISKGLLSTASSEAYDADGYWYMGVDFWSSWFDRQGEKVPWVRMVQERDLRDPADPEYGTKQWNHTMYRAGRPVSHRLRVNVNGMTADERLLLFIETLEGVRPVNQTEATLMLGADTGINASIPGLVSGMNPYFDWYGLLNQDDPYCPPGRGDHPMRLRGVVIPTAASLLGCTSLEDVYGVENVKLAFTAELFPYSEVGPAADSRFERMLFEAVPKMQTRLRLETAWDGGGP